MQHNSVKTKLYEGGSSVGLMMFEFNSPGTARATAAAGAEYALFDMEHTGWSIETIRLLCGTSRGTNMIPMVRVPAADYHFIARVLDVGAMGVMVPMVESVEQAQRFVQYAKYPPVGRRGSAFGVAHDDYTGGSVLEKMQSANEQTLLIAQIETAAGLNCVEEIAAVPGIDVLWIGQFDLSASLGIPGQFTHPMFVAAVDRVIAACHAHGKIGGFMTTTLELGEWVAKKGFRMLAWSGDVWIYQAALKQGLESMRKFAGS
jgi:2-dehydro-3-deoxyglucarate aldolase/4-hydroxy-2-oxoheptanedioate aldolase